MGFHGGYVRVFEFVLSRYLHGPCEERFFRASGETSGLKSPGSQIRKPSFFRCEADVGERVQPWKECLLCPACRHFPR